METTGAGDPTKTAEERLNELLRDAPTQEDLWALLPDPEEATATINRLLEEMTADR